jgi:hypothetical protein
MKMESSKWTKEFEDNPLNTSELWLLTAGDDQRKYAKGPILTTAAAQLRPVA